jgi:hypothetical protein
MTELVLCAGIFVLALAIVSAIIFVWFLSLFIGDGKDGEK